jgi:hypothetical protein
VWLPYGMELPDDVSLLNGKTSAALSEQEQAEQKLKAVRMQINKLSNLPIIKLSLDVKLAQHQGRNLLREMAAELQYKVGRKVAERDYLTAQINIHGGMGDGN